jgi:hypothetical protein
VHELAVLLALDVNNTPAVFAATDRLAINDHVAFRAYDGERDHALQTRISWLMVQPTP